jgi:hypothetical protein
MAWVIYNLHDLSQGILIPEYFHFVRISYYTFYHLNISLVFPVAT